MRRSRGVHSSRSEQGNCECGAASCRVAKSDGAGGGAAECEAVSCRTDKSGGLAVKLQGVQL